MNEKLQKICEEILENESESKKFAELQNPEDMYDYFREKVPELTEDEFDSFIAEALDKYVSMQEKPEVVTEALDSVSGGINFGKFSKQIVAGAMAMLSLGSATMASNTQKTNFGGNINTVKTQNTIKQTGKFQKITNWIKNHKALSTLIGAGILIGGTWAVKKFVIDRKPNEKDNKQGNNQTEIPKTGDAELDKKIEDTIANINKQTSLALKKMENKKQEIDKIINDTVKEVNDYHKKKHPNAGVDAFLHFESGKNCYWTFGGKNKDGSLETHDYRYNSFDSQIKEDMLGIIRQASKEITPYFNSWHTCFDTLKDPMNSPVETTLKQIEHSKQKKFKTAVTKYVNEAIAEQKAKIDTAIESWNHLAQTLIYASGHKLSNTGLRVEFQKPMVPASKHYDPPKEFCQ